MISIFASSHLGHPFAETIHKTLSPEVPRLSSRTHGGLHRGNKSFEQRWKCGFYPWTDYTQNGEMLYDEWTTPCASEERQEEAFAVLRRDWEGARYNVGQAYLMGAAALWHRIGVKHRMPLQAACVCTSLVWRYVDLLGGDYQYIVRWFFRLRDEFGPMDLVKLTLHAPSLFVGKAHPEACRCHYCKNNR